MTPNTEPIPVKEALRLCDMAIEDCDKATKGPWLQRGEGIDAVIWENAEIAVACTFRPDTQTALANSAFIVLSRAVMRPMMEFVKCRLSLYHGGEFEQAHHLYQPLAALRDHYDRVRPDWRVSK